MASKERSIRLASLPLSGGVLALATGRYVSDVFRFRCAPARDVDFQGVALWECGDSIVTCRVSPTGTEFTVEDVDIGRSEMIARSAQGLLFWLFSHLIDDRNWDDDRQDLAELLSAAEAVGFRYFDEVDQFQREFGARGDYGELVRQRAMAVPG